MNSSNEQLVSEIVAKLEMAWNAADGAGFARYFAEDADFVNIRADYFHTRDVIERGHQGIFDTIYKDSVVRYQMARVREISPKVLLAHCNAKLKVPMGPLAGELDSLFSMVLVQDGDWRIASFHNTLAAK